MLYRYRREAERIIKVLKHHLKIRFRALTAAATIVDIWAIMGRRLVRAERHSPK